VTTIQYIIILQTNITQNTTVSSPIAGIFKFYGMMTPRTYAF